MDLQTFLGTSLAATIAALAITVLREAMAKHRRAAAHLRAMLLEAEEIERCARGYNRDSAAHDYWAPAYRLPTTFLQRCLIEACEGQRITDTEVRHLHRLLTETSQVNLCLERLHSLRDVADQCLRVQQMTRETKRARKKCEHVMARLPLARAEAAKALKRLTWWEVDTE
jgi:hypothetical protein